MLERNGGYVNVDNFMARSNDISYAVSLIPGHFHCFLVISTLGC